MRTCILLLLGCTLLYPSAWGQTAITHQPRNSQRAIVSQTIGMAEIWVIYHRPAVNARDIWGAMVPYDAVWRAGANENTVFKCTEDIRIEGQPLPAGKYGFHVIPEADSSVLIFSHNSSSWGSFSYNQEEDALRVKVANEPAPCFQERLQYSFDQVRDDSTRCVLSWADRNFPFWISTDVPAQVVASLEKQLQTQAGWGWQGWHEAAQYCLNQEVAMAKGLGWATRSVFMQPNGANMLTKARLTAAVKGAEGEEEYRIMLASLENDLKSQPVTWKEYHAVANFCFQQGAWREAATFCEQSISMHEQMPNLMLYAHILEAENQVGKAATFREKAIEKASNAQLNNYGYQLLFAGKVDAAVAIFEANARKFPEDPNVHDSLGEGYYQQGEHTKAIHHFKKSLSLNPPAQVRANSMKHLEMMGVSAEQ